MISLVLLAALLSDSDLLSTDYCINHIGDIGACCVLIDDVVQVIVPDGEAVKVIRMPEHFKRTVCKKINNMRST